MTRRSLELSDALHEYILAAASREPALFAELRAETAKLRWANMQSSPEQGQLMGLLVELIGARRCIEIGTFTGYGALWIASALPSDGRLICCDIDPETTAIGRRFWQRAGLADRIELRLGPARDTLAALGREYPVGSFDFVFIDADKREQDGYYEAALGLVRGGGLILVDNVLWSGRVADPSGYDATTAAIDALNRKMRADERIAFSLLPVGDGLSIARKR